MTTQGPNARTIKGAGWTMSIDGQFPVQGEGTVDGFPAFFRARGNTAALYISLTGSVEAVVSAVITDDPYAAGAITDDEARKVIDAMMDDETRAYLVNMMAGD